MSVGEGALVGSASYAAWNFFNFNNKFASFSSVSRIGRGIVDGKSIFFCLLIT